MNSAVHFGMVAEDKHRMADFYRKAFDWKSESSDTLAQHPPGVIAVRNIEEAMKKVSEAGGEVLGQPKEIPGSGIYVSFFDTEGNRVGMLQPNRGWLTQ